MNEQQIDKEIEQMNAMVVEASLVVSRFIFAHCLARSDMNVAAANEVAVEMANQYRDALVEAVRKLIAEAGADIAAHVAAEECIKRAASGGLH